MLCIGLAGKTTIAAKKLNDVVTDWSYALICFLVSMLFPWAILTIFRIANVFVGLIYSILRHVYTQ